MIGGKCSCLRAKSGKLSGHLPISFLHISDPYFYCKGYFQNVSPIIRVDVVADVCPMAQPVERALALGAARRALPASRRRRLEHLTTAPAYFRFCSSRAAFNRSARVCRLARRRLVSPSSSGSVIPRFDWKSSSGKRRRFCYYRFRSSKIISLYICSNTTSIV
jgi:hypothetical protein